MRRRDLFGFLSLPFFGFSFKEPVKEFSAAEAKFDGSFRLWNASNVGSGYNIRLARAKKDSPNKYKIANDQMGTWLNEDGSVEKVVYRNKEGKLFELKFFPLN